MDNYLPPNHLSILHHIYKDNSQVRNVGAQSDKGEQDK